MKCAEPSVQTAIPCARRDPMRTQNSRAQSSSSSSNKEDDENMFMDQREIAAHFLCGQIVITVSISKRMIILLRHAPNLQGGD